MALTKVSRELLNTSIVDNGNATAITIDSSENVGIGTSSPSAILDVKGAAARIRISDTDTAGTTGIEFVDSGGTKDAEIEVGNSTQYLAFKTATAERMRIDSSGNVGIGTTSPSQKLEVAGNVVLDASNAELNLKSGITGTSGAINWTFNTESTEFASIKLPYDTRGTTGLHIDSGYPITIDHSGYTVFAKSGVEQMRLDGNGRLVIANAGGSNTGYIRVPVAGSTLGAWTSYAGTASTRIHMRFQSSSGLAGYISTTGLTTFYGTSSDYRLKTDAQPMTGATARLKALKPLNFEWIADGTRVDGFLAHEAQAVVPECVTGEKDAMMEEEYEVSPEVLDEEGNTVEEAVMGTRSVPEYQGIDQSKLVPLLVATIQELEARITQLENN
jgi:hypothetical protein